MKLIDRLAGRGRKGFEQPPFWTLGAPSWWPTLDGSETPQDYAGYVEQGYRQNGIVFACILTRLLLFSEARFQWRSFSDGRPGDLHGTDELALLDRPWPGATTGDLLARMETDVSLAGNAFLTTTDDTGRYGRSATGPGRRVVRMRPDRVTIVAGSRSGRADALDVQAVGYAYRPAGGATGGEDDVLLPAADVAHYAPIPDPMHRWRGMSWLTPILREIEGDKAATVHKGRFFRNGASPALAITLDKQVRPADFERFKALFESQHRGAENAYKTLFLGGGADAKPLTMDMRQLDFKLTQGAGETRIAAAAGVPPVIVGLSEGLQSATYSNYGQARRRFADGTMRPLWRSAAGALQALVTPPAGSALWYDDRDIAFLREDQSDLANIQGRQAETVARLCDAGFTPESVIGAVMAEDFTQLQHSGLFSVQLQTPGTDGAPTGGAPAALPSGAPSATPEPDKAAEIRGLTEMVQKVYLGVGKVLTAQEARDLLNRAGAGLLPLPADSPLIAPPTPTPAA